MKNQFILFTISVMLLLLSACQNKEEVPGPRQKAPASFVRELDADIKKMIDQSLASATTSSGAARLSAPLAVAPLVALPPGDPDAMTEAQWIAEGYTESFNNTQLSVPVRNIIGLFNTDLTNWLMRAETRGGTDAQILADLKNTIRQSYNRSGTYTWVLDPRPPCICPPGRNFCDCPPLGLDDDVYIPVHEFGLTNMEAQAALETFYGVEQSMDQAYSQMLAYEQSQQGAASGRFWRRLWQGVARVAVAVAVTALVVAVPVAAVVVGKVLLGVATKSVGAAVTTALVKGVAIAGSKVSAALGTGIVAGAKNAAKNWTKEWRGLEEFLYFDIKIKKA